MPQKSTPKQKSPSAKNIGSKDVKKKTKAKRKLKPGLLLVIVGEPEFYLLDVHKNGKVSRTAISSEVIVECVMYVIQEGIKEITNSPSPKDMTNIDNSDTNIESESNTQK